MSLTKDEIFNIYVEQSRNVRGLKSCRLSLVKDINRSLLRNQEADVALKTKMLCLLYSAWSEAQFIQILHTPNGFPTAEIDRIKAVRNATGIGNGWREMIESAVMVVGKPQFNPDLRKKQDFLLQVVDTHITKPSLLRNKIAHGQWAVALNRDCTRVNQEVTDQLADLDYVRVDLQFDIHDFLGMIVRDLVQAPKKTFHRDYWVHHTELSKFQRRTANWTSESKRLQLAKKPIRLPV